ncbi:UNVERIFIED_CONTAM: hypothetical protein Sindi_2224800 [Sesamum indicum]
MVFVRQDRHMNMPPHQYHPDTDSITLSLHYNGVARHIPEAVYVGGRVSKYDYVSPQEINIETLNLFCDSLGLGKDRAFYIIVNKGFKLLIDNNDMKRAWRRIRKNDREMMIYVEVMVGEGAVEMVEEGEGVAQMVEKGTGVAETEMGEGGEEPFTFLGAEVNEGEGEGAEGEGAGAEGEGEGVEGDDLVDSDYEGVEGELEVGGENVGVERESGRVEGENDSDEDDGESSEEVDVVDNDRELDEKRDSDGDGEGPSHPLFNVDETYNPTFEIGMLFSTKKECKKALQSHAIKSKRTLKFTKNDKRRIYAECGDADCQWKLHAIKVKDEETFQINLLQSHHSCPQIFDVKNMKSNWLKDRVDVINELRVNVSKSQAYRAKKAALKEIEGAPEWQYSRLWDYAEEIRRTNPGSTVVLGTEDNMTETRFSRIYVGFAALKRGWKAGCRPIIGVDGCQLKGPHGGILLTTVGVDPNNNLFPICYAVVDKECRETWEWFLIILKHDLNIVRDFEYTFMSDKQKGLMQALGDVFAGSDHRFCVRHLNNNFKNAGFRGQRLKNALWNAARACTVTEWKKCMEDLKKLSEAAHDWLNDKPPTQWSRSHFSEINTCDMLLNNVCEAFNGCIIDAREKPILTMLEWIREYLMRRMQENRNKCAAKWKKRLCPKIQKILQKQINKISDCIPIKADDQHYQVSCFDGSQHAVDLGSRSCSCRRWQLSGIPCKHGCCAIYFQKLDPVDYVNECYSVETYKKVYAPAILPMSHETLWHETSIIPPLPPNFGRGPGRPKKARRRESDEPPSKKKKKTAQDMRGAGHNSTNCPQRMQTESQQDQASHEVGHTQTEQHERATKKAGKRKATEPTTEPEIEQLGQATSSGSRHTNILPPLQVQDEDEQPEACLTQDQMQPAPASVPPLPVFMPGPSMFEQLHMNNPGTTLQSRVTIRAPPSFRGRQILPSFSTRPQTETSEAILKEGGQKFLKLNK